MTGGARPLALAPAMSDALTRWLNSERATRKLGWAAQLLKRLRAEA